MPSVRRNPHIATGGGDEQHGHCFINGATTFYFDHVWV